MPLYQVIDVGINAKVAVVNATRRSAAKDEAARIAGWENYTDFRKGGAGKGGAERVLKTRLIQVRKPRNPDE